MAGKGITTKTLLDYIQETVTASSECDLDHLMILMRPTEDREEMGAAYNELLGYNPITYFDEKYLHREYANIISRAPSYIKETLRDKEDQIIEQAMDKYDSLRDDFLVKVLAKVVMDETGWDDPELSAGEFELDDDGDDPVEEEDGDLDGDNDFPDDEGDDY